MAKKYQVFISSTFIDLIDERQAAVEAILKAGHIPAGMELFKSGKTQLETIKRWIDDSDIYMLILGERYGSIDELSGKSYTEIEYEYALSKGMPVFAVIINKEMTESKLRDKKMSHEELFEKVNYPKLEIFKKYVSTKVVSFASTLSDIKLAVHENINEFKEEYNLVGWIKSTTINDEQIYKQLNDVNLEKQNLLNQIKELETKLKQFTENKVENLSQGKSKYAIEGRYIDKANSGTYDKTVILSWEEIFIILGPYLFEPKTLDYVKKDFSEAIKNKFGYYLFSIKESSLQQIKIQLMALGLLDVYNAKNVAGGLKEFISLNEKGKAFLLEKATIKTKKRKIEN